MNKFDMVNCNVSFIVKSLQQLEHRNNDIHICNLIKDTIDLRDQGHTSFSYEELTFLINTLCVE